ncbi:MAG TPA: SprT family zinc-dependent metalloprotease [Candidatus Sulfotelmatobacter sp.]|nr:SprT family zinc-dependent metalloprotease [Candidatus Sulfotelmatobacter sp.]
MPFKEFYLEPKQTIKIYKRRNARNIRLSVDAHGQIKVSIPTWAPYQAGLQFAKKHSTWIEDKTPKKNILASGQAVGKSHHLYFNRTNSNKVTTRVSDTEVLVFVPQDIEPTSPPAQTAARRGSIKALRMQSEKLLPQRVAQLAAKSDTNYSSIKVKPLKSRWGSCDQRKNIVLNIYLMQLPWELIDYVILHELTHTKVLKHNDKFWATLSSYLPKAKALRKELNTHNPVVVGTYNPLMP